jgi:hypothetical protein
MFPPSDRSKPIIEALLAYPDAGTEADHLEIFRGVAQIVRSTVGDCQKLGDLFHPVNERGVSDGFAGLVRRFYGRVWSEVSSEITMEFLTENSHGTASS